MFDLDKPKDDPFAIWLRFDILLNLQKEIEIRQKYKKKNTLTNEQNLSLQMSAFFRNYKKIGIGESVIYIDSQKVYDLNQNLTLQKLYYRPEGYYQTAKKI